MALNKYTPRERYVEGVKVHSRRQLAEDLGAAFVRDSPQKSYVGCPEPGEPIVQVFNVAMQEWQSASVGDYIVKEEGGNYAVRNGFDFDKKYTQAYTRDQGFLPARMPDVIGRNDPVGPLRQIGRERMRSRTPDAVVSAEW